MTLSSDKQTLKLFAKDFYSWLDSCYFESKLENSWPRIAPYLSLRSAGLEAWAELKQYQSLENFQHLIEETTEDKLQRHGLTGRQLSYKILVLNDLIERMHRVKIKGRFNAKLIDAIDTILDSLIGAVGAGTALKEIKDMLRAQV